MIYIRNISVAVLLVIINALNAGCLRADNHTDTSSEKHKSSNQSQIYVFEPKESMGSFSKGLASVSEAFAPMREAEKLFESGRYDQAKLKYLEALKLHQQKKMDEWLPRYGLADTYEKLNDKPNAIENLNWLIGDCQSEITKKDLITRRNNLLIRKEQKGVSF